MNRAGALRFSPSRRRHRGLGMTEALISLALCAILLLAVGLAFRAASEAVEENDEFLQAAQAARVASKRILTDLRRGTINTNITVDTVELINSANKDITYHWDSAAKQLKLITNYSTTDPDYVLARNVTNFSLQSDPDFDADNNPCISRVVVSMTVQVGNNQVILCGAASPRKSLLP